MFDREQIKANFDLVTYAENFTKLKHRGNEWLGLCPFHNEKTASFNIKANEEVWYCFGCGCGGDSFDFVAKANNLDIVRDFKSVCEVMGGEDYKATEIVKQRKVENTKKQAEPIEATEEQMQSVFCKGERYELVNVYQYLETLIKCRYENEQGKKTFRWYFHNGNSWCFGTCGAVAGLYWAIPENEVKKPNGIVFVAEGEKSAEAVAKCGYMCVCNGDGADFKASKWKNEHTRELRAYDVYVLNDDDCLKSDGNKGQMFAIEVVSKLQDVVKSVKRIDINEVLQNTKQIDGYDIADVVETIGIERTREILNRIVEGKTEEETALEIVANKVSSSNDMMVEIIAKASEEKFSTGRISLDTQTQISLVAKRCGVGIKAIKEEINIIVAEREQNKRNSITIASADTQMIEINGKEWDMCDTDYFFENGQILNINNNSVVLAHICLPCAKIYDVEERKYKEMLIFNKTTNRDEFTKLIVNPRDIHDKGRIINLAEEGIEVTSDNAGELVRFIQQARIKLGEKMKVVNEINRIGWYKGYLLPYEKEEANIIIKESGNEYSIAKAYMSTKGSREKSIEMLNEILTKVEISPIVLGSVISSLFMEKLGRKGQTHVLNINGESGRGKSVLIKLIYSLFGDSVNGEYMFGGADSTLNSSQNTAGYLRNFPIYLDDPLQAGKEDIKSAQQRIYNLVSGEGRQRLNRNGESRKSKEWFCNILYTNESALYSADEQLKGGVLSRILDIELESEISQDDINRWLVDIAKNNFGHFGKEFAEKIRNLEVEDINEEIQREYDKFDKLGVDRKRGNTSACISYGYRIACEVLGLNIAFPYEVIVSNVQKAGEISDGLRAWKRFSEWLDGNIHNFRHIIDRNNVMWGNLDYYNNEKVVNIQVSKLKEICQQLRIPLNSMMVHCASKNAIVINDKKPTRTTRIKNDNVMVVSFYLDWNEPQTADEFYKEKINYDGEPFDEYY